MRQGSLPLYPYPPLSSGTKMDCYQYVYYTPPYTLFLPQTNAFVHPTQPTVNRSLFILLVCYGQSERRREEGRGYLYTVRPANNKRPHAPSNISSPYQRTNPVRELNYADGSYTHPLHHYQLLYAWYAGGGRSGKSRSWILPWWTSYNAPERGS